MCYEKMGGRDFVGVGESEVVMQFTKAEEYGMLGVLYLAQKHDSSVTPLSEISEARQIPEKFLAKIFQALAKSGIVKSYRGVRGGFTLSRDPERINVREILESIQGPFHLVKSKTNGGSESVDLTALRELMQLAENRMVHVFEEYSLADLAHGHHSHTAVS